MKYKKLSFGQSKKKTVKTYDALGLEILVDSLLAVAEVLMTVDDKQNEGTDTSR
ncbi:hypothetical protein INT48_005424 [Thamnidium elegans]|uniref:Uncharacterized protein n=1 Tax=Thamnidium elegans TaxID=101142 RepID=A0A8H7SN46_9FUNG|nr:hypothetical protein INT48_005424 [Thamnidium elegans]